ncbi:transglutaminase-like domain-containing protein [Brevibacillus fluminis]|uniref:transglutaminase-like domain-containing protein n=1 Tax=Brevibacillus fluminis TaxID=511487 RepID=UPI003F8B7996
MRKWHFSVLFFVICLITTPAFALASVANSRIDAGEADRGIVKVQDDPAKKAKEAVIISKDGQRYYYNMNANNRFPLQLGDGTYTVSVVENVAGNKYKMVEKKEVVLAGANEQAVFLQPIQMIYWNDSMQAIAKAKELTKAAKSDKEKIEAIYRYLITNYSYDYPKAETLANDYIPSIEATWASKKGICYDFASMFAAMLRSQGIPAKLMMGRKNDVTQYHAWNEVYIKETNQWVTIDTTYDSIVMKSKKAPVMIKDKREYQADKQF